MPNDIKQQRKAGQQSLYKAVDDSEVFTQDAIHTLFKNGVNKNLCHNGLALKYTGQWLVDITYMRTRYTQGIGHYPEMTLDMARYTVEIYRQEIVLNLFEEQ